MKRALLLCVLLVAGCDRMPGKPKPSDKWQSPSAVSDFTALYNGNCLGCHGRGAVVSGSIAMDNPTFLSVVPRDALRRATENGIPGTAMPAFSISSGGTLTDNQIEILVNGILAKKTQTAAGPLPAYSAAPGDVAAGHSVFAAACASCHGTDGTGGEKAGSVASPAYLGLVSDQYLRTIVIAGRPDLGCPGFANRIPGRAMTDAEIADVTAWLASNRKNEFGQPLVPPAPSQP
jgi:cytochrome c oxidase cbb3-type subunit III